MASNENTARSQSMFGNFDILETVGQGGMGVVYRAHDVSLGRDVALKVLKDELRAFPKVVARFRREAEAIASLDHPNIVQVYSVGAVGKIPYFAMEFIEGKPLHRILRRHKSLKWKYALRIARDVAEALAAAHDAQIIHRDIKPGNIIVDRTGRAFVTDFGIAKVLTAETQLTVDGSKLGTPQYMSPERCQNHEITLSSDIYSLGVVLFQMLTGKLPYQAKDPIELIRQIIVDAPARISDYKEDMPDDIERLAAYLLEKKPEHRPRDAHEVVELLTRVLDGKPLFESDSGFDGAFEELREEVSTPYSDTTQDTNTARRAPIWERAWEALDRRWTGIPARARFSAVLSSVTLLAAIAGLAVSSFGRTDRAAHVVSRFSTDPSAWYQQGELASFYRERADFETVRFHQEDWRIAAIGWSDDGAPLVLLRSVDGGAVCRIDLERRAADILEGLDALPEGGADLRQELPRLTRVNPDGSFDLGGIEADSTALDDAGERLLGMDGGGRIVVVNVRSGMAIASLGNALDARWYGADSVALFALDRKEAVQVWRVEVQVPDEREQLTYFDGGVSRDLFSAGPDGRLLVVSARAEDRTVGILNP